MGKDRSRRSARSRKVATRTEHEVIEPKTLLTFNFKDFDQAQPKKSPETVQLWQEMDLIPKLVGRLKELSELTIIEACDQKQIKTYSSFPPENKTDFFLPSHIDKGVTWGVIEGLGGRPRVAGYLKQGAFYVVFLDSEHKFWKSEKKHT